ncbi:MAG: hypothetical protein KAJ97_08095 [Acidobacteria bacterium]|nr:hypothetical protein [Acidobacteriota bacterium]
MTIPRISFLAATLCCLALIPTGCRRTAEEPAGIPAQEERAQTADLTSEYFVAYPGAEVDIAGLEQNPTLLMQTVNATPDEVVAYYTRYYAERGWTEGPVLDQPDFFSQAFMGPGGWVTLTVRAPEAGRRQVGLVYTERPQ